MLQLHPPIAMLHSVSDSVSGSDDNWCISRKAFLQLLDFLEESHFHTTHFAEIKQPGVVNRSSSRRVILSFDDCYKHLYDFAIPELVKRRMKAVFYLPTANIGGYNSWDVEKGMAKMEVMNESEIKELGHLGMEVGSHTHRHVDLKVISDHVKLQEEVVVSRQVIEQITGKPVYSFAYPYGSVPPGYKKLLANAGYHFGVCIYHPFETKFTLRRFGIYEKDTKESLHRKFSTRYQLMRKIYDVIKKY